jgi:hypothetical protein
VILIVRNDGKQRKERNNASEQIQLEDLRSPVPVDHPLQTSRTLLKRKSSPPYRHYRNITPHMARNNLRPPVATDTPNNNSNSNHNRAMDTHMGLIHTINPQPQMFQEHSTHMDTLLSLLSMDLFLLLIPIILPTLVIPPLRHRHQQPLHPTLRLLQKKRKHHLLNLVPDLLPEWPLPIQQLRPLD